MPGKVLRYPSLDAVPALFVNIIHARTGRKELFPMVIDTGASRTCIPAKYAEFFGHDNLSKAVKTDLVRGIGGESSAFVHTLRFELIDPKGKTWSKLVPPWRSSNIPVRFVEKMDVQMGLLGRDVLAQWTSISLRRRSKGRALQWDIEIVI